MSLPIETQVLIVGAGPSAMASAITLASLGLQLIVVDSNTINAYGSRAAVIHSQVLEVLAPLGLSQPIIDAGIISPGERLHGSTNTLLEIDISMLRDDTQYPFAVHIAQDTVEKIFLEKIKRDNIPLFRNKKVVGMHVTTNYGGVEVTFEDGTTIRSQYVVGADGSRSMVRQLNSIEFKDPLTGISYEEAKPDFNMVLADVYLKEPLPRALPRDRVSLYLDNFLLLVPLRSGESAPPHGNSASRWRIGYGLPPDGIPPHNPSKEHLQKEINARNPWDTELVVDTLVVSSRYRIRYAIAATYFKKMGEGIILLAGDAAHVHSPAGGQGVNTGIRDGIAAANAIHSHFVTGKEEILRKYSDTRRKIGIDTIEFSRNLTNLVDNTWHKYLRNLAMHLVGNIPSFNRRSALMLSGLIHSRN